MAEKVNGEKLSARQLAVASVVAAFSPAAVYAGRAPWFWVLLWSLAGVAAAVLILWWMRKSTQSKMCRPLRVLYAGWAVVLSSRVLSGSVERLEQTSGGSPRFWLLLILAVPLLLIGWGGAAPFFRMAEILWLAMAATLALVLILGIGRIEWRYALVDAGDWKTAALGAAELFAPMLYALPYIYNVKKGESGNKSGWLFVPGAVCSVMCLLTTGILGAGGGIVPQAFFVAAGVVGQSARMEGLLSVIWLLPDLIYVGLLCRSWGEKRWPAVAVLLSAVGSMFGIANNFAAGLCALVSLILLVMTLVFAGRPWNFVVKKRG